jgi:hypothetical protein
MKKPLFLVLVPLLLAGMAVGEGKENAPATQSVWSVAVPSFTAASGAANLVKAILTPSQSIVVTRIEAFSERGPIVPSSSGSPKPCPRTVCSADFKRHDYSQCSHIQRIPQEFLRGNLHGQWKVEAALCQRHTCQFVPDRPGARISSRAMYM